MTQYMLVGSGRQWWYETPVSFAHRHWRRSHTWTKREWRRYRCTVEAHSLREWHTIHRRLSRHQDLIFTCVGLTPRAVAALHAFGPVVVREKRKGTKVERL